MLQKLQLTPKHHMQHLMNPDANPEPQTLNLKP
jgi:hypothetical protein